MYSLLVRFSLHINIDSSFYTTFYTYQFVIIRSVAYCNRKCQSKHYQIHKETCWKLARQAKQKQERGKEKIKKMEQGMTTSDDEYDKKGGGKCKKVTAVKLQTIQTRSDHENEKESDDTLVNIPNVNLAVKSSGSLKRGYIHVDSLETLLDTILSEYIQICTVPAGKVQSEPVTSAEGCESLCLMSLRPFDQGCPRNLCDFITSATEGGHQIEPETAFAWWARSRIRYSCSTITAAFVKHMVPYMKRMGLTELRTTINQTIRLADLEIFSLGFIPNKTHSFVLNHGFTSTTEKVEALQEGTCRYCSHNVLKCRKSGIVIDPTLGQFLGVMNPFVFSNKDQLFSLVPGTYLFFKKTSEIAIDDQITRDKFLAKISPDVGPQRFTKRVFRAVRDKKGFCNNCKGGASVGYSLKKCTQCKKALYCCKKCQVLHWKMHKLVCNQL